jgi:hypothetical protein
LLHIDEFEKGSLGCLFCCSARVVNTRKHERRDVRVTGLPRTLTGARKDALKTVAHHQHLVIANARRACGDPEKTTRLLKKTGLGFCLQRIMSTGVEMCA